MKNLKYFTFLIFLIAANADASVTEDATTEDLLMEELYPQNTGPMLEVTKDAVSWNVFDSTKGVKDCTFEDGLTNCILKPQYSPQIKALNGKKVILMGYMFPLEQTELQKNFLFGPYPMNCSFHYHTTPALVVEVLATNPIKFSSTPIKIEGVLDVRFNADTEVFYYLKNAVMRTYP